MARLDVEVENQEFKIIVKSMVYEALRNAGEICRVHSSMRMQKGKAYGFKNNTPSR